MLVHRPAYDDWTLPKGKLEAGEEVAHAALREVEEETGVRCVRGRELASTRYVDSSGRPKEVRYWLMAAAGEALRPANEVDDAVWASVEDAAGILTHERDRTLLARLAPPSGTTRAYLVRHAVAKRRDRWHGPDSARPLTGRGRRQAAALPDVLAGAALNALVSSPSLRCLETFGPLADASALDVQEHAALAEASPPLDALHLVQEAALLGPSALCTHGDVQQGVLETLLAAGATVPPELRFEKGSTWILRCEGGEVAEAAYVPPTG